MAAQQFACLENEGLLRLIEVHGGSFRKADGESMIRSPENARQPQQVEDFHHRRAVSRECQLGALPGQLVLEPEQELHRRRCPAPRSRDRSSTPAAARRELCGNVVPGFRDGVDGQHAR